MDFCSRSDAVATVNSIRIAWGVPYATRMSFSIDGRRSHQSATRGVWQTFAQAAITAGKGGTETVRLAATPVAVRFVRFG